MIIVSNTSSCFLTLSEGKALPVLTFSKEVALNSHLVIFTDEFPGRMHLGDYTFFVPIVYCHHLHLQNKHWTWVSTLFVLVCTISQAVSQPKMKHAIFRLVILGFAMPCMYPPSAACQPHLYFCVRLSSTCVFNTLNIAFHNLIWSHQRGNIILPCYCKGTF